MDFKFASTLDLTTTAYFLLQVIKFPLTRVQCPEVDRLPVADPTQFASVYTSTLMSMRRIKHSFPHATFEVFENLISSLYMS